MSFVFGIVSLESLKSGADPGLWGTDETYVKVNGAKVWSHDFNTGDRFDVNFHSNTHKFDAKISLYDKDFGFWNSDDHMGSITIKPGAGDPLNQAVFRQAELSGSGSKYLLTYYTVDIDSNAPVPV